MNMLARLLRSPLERLGYRLAPFDRGQVIPPMIPDPERYTGPEDFSRLFRPWLGGEFGKFFTPEVVANTMLSPKKLYVLLQLFRQTLGMPGDVFEAGVGSGGSARLMLDCLQRAGVRRRIWLLDTFEGYQKVDPARDGQHVRVNQCRANTVEQVGGLLANNDCDVRLIKGLIPATLGQVHADAFSFAHIDVNLYEPTLAATEFCLQRLAPGAIMLFDDYCWPATYSARQAVAEACARAGQQVICVPESTQAFLIKVAPGPRDKVVSK